MSQDGSRTDLVKGSNLGFVIGILLVVAVVMFVLRSSFVQNRINKDEAKVETTEEVGGFEIIDEPEITLFDEDMEFEISDSEDEIVEEVDTHEPVDTAIGDINPMLLSVLFLMGAGGLYSLSKRLA